MAAAETGVVENPLAVEEGDERMVDEGDVGAAAQRSGVDLEAGLRDGTLTTEQAFALQERQSLSSHRTCRSAATPCAR